MKNKIFNQIIEKFTKVPASFATFHQKIKFKEQLLPLRGFDAIFVRKDPPIDNAMLNFLDSITSDILILNSTLQLLMTQIMNIYLLLMYLKIKSI